MKFIGIGTQKAGTTWLYTMLKQHPSVFFPAGKEIHFWDKQYPGRPESSYLEIFSSDDSCEGEITPAYGHLSREVIKVIWQQAPDVRLIYILRNPIERAWSSALMAMRRAELEPDEVSDAWFLDHFHSKGSLSRGDYERCIKNWLHFFPREQLLLLDFNEVQTSPKQLYHKCCAHLGVRQLSNTELGQLALQEKIFAGEEVQFRPSLKAALESLYKVKIYSLSNYLGWDLSAWLQ